MTQREIDIRSNDNTLFVTGQCDNRCVMCCQPPTTADDIAALWDENLRRLSRAPRSLPVIGITGGEPTLLGGRLVTLIRAVRERLPETDIHLLSNGRRFADKAYAKAVAEASEGRVTFGIPLHSDYSDDHDRIAGVRGAYAETICGLYNLAAQGAAIELRVVMSRLTSRRLASMAEFIHKNLCFVAWTAFMGMERTGFAETRHESCWVEPQEYMSQLAGAVTFLDAWHHEVAIYNLPLCLLTPSLHRFAAKSISDWKNCYAPLCAVCAARQHCCGLFATSSQPYCGLRPFHSYTPPESSC